MMKTMKLVLIVAAMISVVTMANAQKIEKTVVYNVEIECENCKAKIEKNIPYEKGVKDLKVDIGQKTVTVIFREDKNTAEGIKKALEEQKIPVTGFKEIVPEVKKKSSSTEKAELTSCGMDPKKECCDKK